MQTGETEHHWIVRLWRFVVLFLYLGAFILIVAAWVQSGDFSEAMYPLVLLSIIIIITAGSVHHEFSINIFGRMRNLAPESERRFVLYSAVGLYLGAIAIIIFASLFAMKIIESSQLIIALIIGLECIVFLAVGYFGINRLRKNGKYHV